VPNPSLFTTKINTVRINLFCYNFMTKKGNINYIFLQRRHIFAGK